MNKLLVIKIVLVTALCIHFFMVIVYLFISPPFSVNVPKKGASIVEGYIDPLFHQRWSMFAPNPASINYKVYARGVYQTKPTQKTKWVDLHEKVKTDVYTMHFIDPNPNFLRKKYDKTSTFLINYLLYEQEFENRANTERYFTALFLESFPNEDFASLELKTVLEFSSTHKKESNIYTITLPTPRRDES